jgi:hypothetical protein
LDREQRSPARSVGLFMLACAVVSGCALLPPAWRQIKARADVTYPESAVAYNAQLAARTGHIYPPISQPPYTPALYGPAFYLALSTIARRTGDLDALLIAGRALSFACFWLTIGGTFFLTKRLGAPAWFAALAAALVFADPEFFRTNVSTRPDLIALALSIWAIGLVVANIERPRNLLAAGVLVGLAVLVKASYVAAPIAIAIWLVRSRKWNALAALGAGAVAPVIVCVAWLAAHGDPVLGQTGLLKSGIHDPVGAFALIARETFHYWPHVIILIGAVVVAGRWLRQNDSPRALAVTYCVLSWAVAALTLMNPGGNVNYLLEPWTISSALFAIALSDLPRIENPWRCVVPALCAVAAIGGTVRDIRVGSDRSVTDDSALAAAAAHRHVLTDLPYVSAHSDAPELLDPFLMTQLEGAGEWDTTPVTNEIQQQRYDFVALTAYHEKLREYRRNAFVSPRLVAAILASYAPFCETAGQGPKGFERLLVLLPKRSIDAQLAGELERGGCSHSLDPGLLRNVTQIAARGSAEAGPAR